ncbi:Exocyst complex component sec15 [Erysiphe neolycopersici]|uniref:Exocyst complex component SEC15 n=1 Tax=Erysiphe neolycopersici TaxID=212602 RepID=A0A420HTT0_9PEZI|nr:Exocyst complex component sec15 [Erysiphe neolycopersici]
MPRKTLQYDDYGSVLREINLSSDNDYLDQLIPILKDAILSNSTSIFQRNLSQYANELDSDIETIGLTKHDEFLKSVNQLQNLREGTVALTKEILQLNQSIQESTENLSEQKRALVDTTAIRQNITDASEALKQSLKILHAVNLAHELIRKKQYYGALKALDDLQIEHLIPAIQNKYATQLKLAILIQESIPLSRKAISEAVMSDLNTWLYRIRETSQFLGEVAFYHTELRRTRQKERLKSNPLLGKFKLNSAIELVFDETEEFDVLDNEELQVDFTPLFECMHIHEALGQGDKFKTQYATTRKQQKELLLPNSVSLVDDDEKSFSGLLESIAGFAIIEKATLRKAQNLRSQVDVDELWDSMCQTAINLISKALDEVADAELLLKIKGVVALFIQTMEGWGYSIISLDNFLLTLFEKYAAILQKRFSDDFLEIVLNDDYMPMPVSNIDEYDKVVNVSWFKPDKPREELTFPCVFPFSQMYPLCCIDICNFLNQFYFFSDDHFQHPSIIDDTLKRSLDLLLSENVCNSLVERLSVQYLSQIVQILINLEHFETACLELEQLLMAARSSTNPGGPIVLSATEKFRSNKKTAEKRIFELVNSKIDDLVETAEYDWVAQTLSPEPSNYMQTLTTYLSNIMSSTLLGLPPSIKELIYFDALSHATTSILSLPLSPQVKAINPNGVAALATDVSYLEEFVSTLPNALLLKDGLDELLQVVALMKLDSPDEFYDLAVRNRKFGRVDPIVGTNILSKLTHTVQSLKPVDTTSAATRLGGFGSRFMKS